jgi:hypothetical protein
MIRAFAHNGCVVTMYSFIATLLELVGSIFGRSV